jgi:hypothetical protein
MNELTIVEYLLSILREDASPLVKQRLAEAIMTSLPVLAVIDDLGQPAFAQPTLTFIEEDASALAPVIPTKPAMPAGSFDLAGIMDTLRQEYGKVAVIRDELLGMLKSIESQVFASLMLILGTRKQIWRLDSTCSRSAKRSTSRAKSLFQS